MEYKRQPIGLSKAILISTQTCAFVIKQEYKYSESDSLNGSIKKTVSVEGLQTDGRDTFHLEC